MKTKALIIAALILSLPAAAQESLVLSIDRCREMALEHNSGAVNAALDVEAARYQKQEALTEYFPRISAMSAGFWSLNPMLEIGLKDILGNNDYSNNLQNELLMQGINPKYTALEHGYGASVNLLQPVFAGGRIVNGNRLAALGVEAAQLQKSLQERKTGEEIDDYYWQTLSLEEKLLTLGEFRELLDTLCKDASSARAAGLMTEDELLQAELKRSELRSSEIKLRSGIRLSKMNLLNSIGQDYCVVEGAASEGKPYIDDIRLEDEGGELLSPERYYVPEEKISASMEEARLLELQVDAKKLEKQMQLGETLPQLAVGASYGYSDLIGKARFNGTAYATLQIPISDWWKTSRKLKRLQVQIDKAENEQAQLDGQLTLLVRKYWIELTSAWDEYEVALDSERAAEVAYRSVKSHYDAGLVPLSDLLQSQASYRQSCNGLTDARTAYRKALRVWMDIADL